MSYIGNIPTTVAFLVDTFSGNGSTTAFTLSQAPANTSSILVAVSGVVQDPSTYSVSGTTLTFSGAPPSGTSNISVRFLGIPASNIATTAYRTVTEFTATAGQTTFSVPSYTPGYIDVYRNGVMLGSADYTATSGTTVVLASGATAGDLVEVISFYVSSVLNAIPAVAGAVNDTYLNTGAVTQSKLATGVAGNGPAFSAYKSVNQTGIASSTFTKVTFELEEFDTNSCYNTSTSRFTPTVAGYYQFNWNLDIGGVTTTLNVADIYKNGTRIKRSNGIAVSNSETYVVGAALVYLNGTTDYVEVYVYIGGSGATVYGTVVEHTYFQAFLARAA
jgi:hypothetical protein